MKDAWQVIRKCPRSWKLTAVAELIMLAYLLLQIWCVFFSCPS